MIKKIIDSLFSKEIEQRMSTMSVQEKIKKKKRYFDFLAERGFDPRTSGLWAQHASTAPLCCCDRHVPKATFIELTGGESKIDQ